MDQPASTRRAVTAMAVAWPAFVLAGVLWALVFALIDPAALAWFGGEPLDWPRQAVYTLAFFLFWAVIGCAAGLSVMLSRAAPSEG